jgi:hypothetical protein
MWQQFDGMTFQLPPSHAASFDFSPHIRPAGRRQLATKMTQPLRLPLQSWGGGGGTCGGVPTVPAGHHMTCTICETHVNIEILPA